MRTRAATVVTLAVALGLALGIAALDQYFAHGYRAAWFVPARGERMALAHTAEHRVRFPNAFRPFARYLENWNFNWLGVPNRFPALDVDLTANITIPGKGQRVLVAKTDNRAELFIDGKPLRGYVSPGVHHLRVHWTGPTYAKGERHWDDPLPVSFELLWGKDPARARPVPRNALTPTGSEALCARQTLWAVGAVAMGVVSALLFFALRRRDADFRMRGVLRLCTVGIFVIAAGLRLFDYDVMPDFRDNDDELFATWNGWQLLDDGTTRGWTLWPNKYPAKTHFEEPEYFRRRPFYVVSPYLEHPPLLHLLVGGAAKLGGAQHWLHAKLHHTRLVPIALSLVALGLLLAIGRRLFPVGPAPWLAALCYAVLPPLVLQQRVIKEETLVTPLFLASTYFYLRYRDSGGGQRALVAAAMFAGIATLAKIPAFVFVPALVVLVLSERAYRDAIVAAVVGVGAASLVVAYAAFVNWKAFWFVTGLQATVRHPDWNAFVRFFDAPKINHTQIGEAWLLFLWLAWAMTLPQLKRRDQLVFGVPLMVYIAAIAIPSGTWNYGWYLLPIYPVLCWGAGKFLADLWQAPDLIRGALVVYLPLFYAMGFTVEPAWLAGHRALVRIAVTGSAALFLACFGIATALSVRPALWVGRAATVVAIVGIVVLSTYFVVSYDSIFATFGNYDLNAVRR